MAFKLLLVASPLLLLFLSHFLFFSQLFQQQQQQQQRSATSTGGGGGGSASSMMEVTRVFNMDYIGIDFFFLSLWLLTLGYYRRNLVLFSALLVAVNLYYIDALNWHNQLENLNFVNQNPNFTGNSNSNSLSTDSINNNFNNNDNNNVNNNGNNALKVLLRRDWTFYFDNGRVLTRNDALIHHDNGTITYDAWNFTNDYVVLKHFCDFTMLVSYSLFFYSWEFFLFQCWRPLKNPQKSKGKRQYNRMIYITVLLFIFQISIAILSSVSKITGVRAATVRRMQATHLFRETATYLGYLLLAIVSYLRDDVYLPLFCFFVGCFQVFAFTFPLSLVAIRHTELLTFGYEILFFLHSATPFVCLTFLEILPIIGVTIQHEEEEPMYIWSRFNFYFRPISGVCRLLLKLAGFNPFKLSAVADVKHYTCERDKELVGDFSDMLRVAAALDEATDNKTKFDPFGLLIMRLVHIWRPLSVRRAVLDYAYTHREELARATPRKPIIITGLPRSGTSLLQELFAQDPYARSLRGWEPQYPLPPVEKDKYFTDFRITHYGLDLFFIDIIDYGFLPRTNQSHVVSVNCFEEDTLAMIQSQLHVVLSVLTDDKVFDICHDVEGKRHCYEYIKLLLQVVGSKFGPNELHSEYGHWVTKSPLHSIFPSLVFDVFPDARVIVAHRDPYEVAASWARLQMTVGSHYPNLGDENFDSRQHMRECASRSLKQIHLMTDRLHKFRKDNPERSNAISDVSFLKLISDPIGTVKQLYKDMDMHYSVEFENNMKKYLEEEKLNRNKYGKAVFDAEKDFGLTKERVHSVMNNYYREYEQYLTITPVERKSRKSI